MHNVSSVLKKEGLPNDEYTVTIPKLGEKTVIIPDTMRLIFNIENSNDKSWFVNNLGRQLQKELKVSYNDVYIYENKDESTYGTYEDLWKSEEEREQLRNTGMLAKALEKYGLMTTVHQPRVTIIRSPQTITFLQLG